MDSTGKRPIGKFSICIAIARLLVYSISVAWCAVECAALIAIGRVRRLLRKARRVERHYLEKITGWGLGDYKNEGDWELYDPGSNSVIECHPEAGLYTLSLSRTDQGWWSFSYTTPDLNEVVPEVLLHAVKRSEQMNAKPVTNTEPMAIAYVEPKVGEVWEHFKGDRYDIVDTDTIDAGDLDDRIVRYRSTKGPYVTYGRKLSEFMEFVARGSYRGPRFWRVPTGTQSDADNS